MPKFPSLVALRKAFGHQFSEAELRDIRFYGKADYDTLLDHPAGKRRWYACYNAPTLEDLRQHVLDTLLGTYGVESWWARDQDQHSCREGPALVYLNAGDSYETTLLFYDDVYHVGCVGDWVEKHG